MRRGLESCHCSSAESCKVADFCLRRKPPRPRRRLAPSTMNLKKTGFWRWADAEGPRCILSPAFGIETCDSRASSTMMALPRRRMGNGPAVNKLTSSRGSFSTFASSWIELAQADKLKGRQCISLLFIPFLSYCTVFYLPWSFIIE